MWHVFCVIAPASHRFRKRIQHEQKLSPHPDRHFRRLGSRGHDAPSSQLPLMPATMATPHDHPDNNGKQRQRLLDEMRQINRADLRQIQEALHRSDWSRITFLAHRIKGTAMFLKAQALVNVSDDLERYCQGLPSAETVAVKVAMLAHEIRRVEPATQRRTK